MSLSVCPAAVVAAPVEMVWANLTEWERYYEWGGVRVERLGSRKGLLPSARPSTSLAINGLADDFKVEAVDPARHQLDWHVFFPLGLQEKPHIAGT